MFGSASPQLCTDCDVRTVTYPLVFFMLMLPSWLLTLVHGYFLPRDAVRCSRVNKSTHEQLRALTMLIPPRRTFKDLLSLRFTALRTLDVNTQHLAQLGLTLVGNSARLEAVYLRASKNVVGLDARSLEGWTGFEENLVQSCFEILAHFAHLRFLFLQALKVNASWVVALTRLDTLAIVECGVRFSTKTKATSRIKTLSLVGAGGGFEEVVLTMFPDLERCSLRTSCTTAFSPPPGIQDLTLAGWPTTEISTLGLQLPRLQALTLHFFLGSGVTSAIIKNASSLQDLRLGIGPVPNRVPRRTMPACVSVVLTSWKDLTFLKQFDWTRTRRLRIDSPDLTALEVVPALDCLRGVSNVYLGTPATPELLAFFDSSVEQLGLWPSLDEGVCQGLVLKRLPDWFQQ